MSTYTIAVTSDEGKNKTVHVSATATLYDLHAAMIAAYKLDDDHQHVFFMDNKWWSKACAVCSHSFDDSSVTTASVTLSELGLVKDQEFKYLFDIGDEHRFVCQVLAVPDAEVPKAQRPVKQKKKVCKLHMELDLQGADFEVLQAYGKVEKGITRDILLPADMPLFALHYVIQRAFGWENTHLHHFALPEKVFRQLTENRLDKWKGYCGIYFRYPDDYSEEQELLEDEEMYNINAYFKRAYKGPYFYYGIGEHMMESKYALDTMLEEASSIPLIKDILSFAVRGKHNGNDPIKSILDASCDMFDKILDFGQTNELLERLRVDEVFYSGRSAEIPDALVSETEARYQANIGRLTALRETYLEEMDIDYCLKMNALNGIVPPMTKTVIYRYDYGDSWEVKIKCVDFLELDPDKPAKDASDELLHTVINEHRPICIEADGLPVLDDVGGIGGYTDMLVTMNEKKGGKYTDEAREIKEWAREMGWTGRKHNPKTIL